MHPQTRRTGEPERPRVPVALERPHLRPALLAAELHIGQRLAHDRPRHDRIGDRSLINVVEGLRDQLLQDSRTFPHVVVIGRCPPSFSPARP